MKRFWLLFSQSVTVLLAAYFVVATLKPAWLNLRGGPTGTVAVLEAPASDARVVPPGSFRLAEPEVSKPREFDEYFGSILIHSSHRDRDDICAADGRS